VSQNIESEWYYVLDAKTWFITPILYNNLFAKDGRSNNKIIDIHSNFNKAVPAINQQFGVDMQQTIGPGGVPFCFHTDTVREMITHITTVSNPGTFHDFFLLRAKVELSHPITEFTIYCGYVLQKYSNYDTLYTGTTGPAAYHVQNVAQSDTTQFDLILARMKTPNCLTASVHKNALASLKLYQLRNWISFLSHKKLITRSTARTEY
jgi:hypothetical protein